jgi:hypothetical protein
VDALEHLDAHLAGGHLAQRDHGRLVAVGVELRRAALGELPRAVGGRERELEPVGDALTR